MGCPSSGGGFCWASEMERLFTIGRWLVGDFRKMEREQT